MPIAVIPAHCFSAREVFQSYDQFNPVRQRPRWTQKRSLIRCCHSRRTTKDRSGKEKGNYYELLGVSLYANSQEIKEAYRSLQKKYHPDIAGPEGHEQTLMLNEAYKVLMRIDLRRDYDASIGQLGARFAGRNTSDLGYSSWKGPLRPQALFVDENTCIGCRECVHHASNTFVMDETAGCARVKVQYGDIDQNIEVSVESCPVNCIHRVDRTDLAILEFLSRPQPLEEYGVFGGGWERPANVFMAAKSFNKHLNRQASKNHRKTHGMTGEEETPAQAEARAYASMQIQTEKFTGFWNFFRELIKAVSSNK